MDEDIKIEQAVKDDGILRLIRDGLDLKEQDAAQLPGLTLAYIGDCIFELVIRTMLISRGITHVSKLSKEATRIVNAAAQCKMLRRIEDELTEKEHAVFKRGRNVKSNSPSKSASIQEYRIATGLEALFGYLYMNGEHGRIVELIKKGLETE